MTDDIVRAFGYLTLGSRFKRIGERLQGDVQRLARSEGIEVPPGLMPVLGALDHHGSLTVGELATALGVAQPGVTRGLAQLKEMGLVTSARPGKDQRQRRVTLSEKGAAQVQWMKADLWPRLARAVEAMCTPLDGSLLRQLDGLEAALDDRALDWRARKEDQT